VMAWIQQNPQLAFPWPISCPKITPGVKCDIQPLWPPFPLNFPIAFSDIKCTSFTLTALKGHFDPEGSTIKFRTYERDGHTFLQLVAHAPGAPWFAEFGSWSVAPFQWGWMANNVRKGAGTEVNPPLYPFLILIV
jgi:hypothetical protein